MRQLSTIQTFVFLFGAIMMVIGAGVYVMAILPFMANTIAPETTHKIGACLFSIGAVCFSTMQMLQIYDGKDFTLRRLRRMQLLGDWCFIFSALLMLENAFLIFFPTFRDGGLEAYTFYLQYIHNNWVVLLLLAVILEVYTTHRISNVIKKT